MKFISFTEADSGDVYHLRADNIRYIKTLNRSDRNHRDAKSIIRTEDDEDYEAKETALELAQRAEAY